MIYRPRMSKLDCCRLGPVIITATNSDKTGIEWPDGSSTIENALNAKMYRGSENVEGGVF